MAMMLLVSSDEFQFPWTAPILMVIWLLKQRN